MKKLSSYLTESIDDDLTPRPGETGSEYFKRRDSYFARPDVAAKTAIYKQSMDQFGFFLQDLDDVEFAKLDRFRPTKFIGGLRELKRGNLEFALQRENGSWYRVRYSEHPHVYRYYLTYLSSDFSEPRKHEFAVQPVDEYKDNKMLLKLIKQKKLAYLD